MFTTCLQVNTDQVSKQDQENDLKWRSQVGFGQLGDQYILTQLSRILELLFVRNKLTQLQNILQNTQMKKQIQNCSHSCCLLSFKLSFQLSV